LKIQGASDHLQRAAVWQIKTDHSDYSGKLLESVFDQMEKIVRGQKPFERLLAAS
jgi:hypothetical protein